MDRGKTERRLGVEHRLAFIEPHLFWDGRFNRVEAIQQFGVAVIRASRESGVPAANDSDWHSEVTLEVAPHPELSETQARVISLDYGMRGGKAKIKVRRALLYYALRRLGLDTDPRARTPQDQQIVLLNREAVADLVNSEASVSAESWPERPLAGTNKLQVKGHS